MIKLLEKLAFAMVVLTAFVLGHALVSLAMSHEPLVLTYDAFMRGW